MYNEQLSAWLVGWGMSGHDLRFNTIIATTRFNSSLWDFCLTAMHSEWLDVVLLMTYANTESRFFSQTHRQRHHTVHLISIANAFELQFRYIATSFLATMVSGLLNFKLTW
jgi:hypothetical protein